MLPFPLIKWDHFTLRLASSQFDTTLDFDILSVQANPGLEK
jgi:hypothetical protein